MFITDHPRHYYKTSQKKLLELVNLLYTNPKNQTGFCASYIFLSEADTCLNHNNVVKIRNKQTECPIKKYTSVSGKKEYWSLLETIYSFSEQFLCIF